MATRKSAKKQDKPVKDTTPSAREDRDLDAGPKLGERGEYLPAKYRKSDKIIRVDR